MAQDEMLLFRGRNRIRYGYARWGYTRGGGKTWHGGADVEGLDDTTIRMPGYGLGAGRHAISGTVVTARRVAQSTGNPTWEWGWYVCVKLDANQTPDAVNYLYFCHNAKNLAAVGQRVKTGDALAVMGNTGNAALASPPYAHCHFEVRTAKNIRVNPANVLGIPNGCGVYTVESAPKWEKTSDGWTYGGIKNVWKQIDGRWYWFDGSGIAVTGPKVVGGKSYWFAQKPFHGVKECQLLMTDANGALR